MQEQKRPKQVPNALDPLYTIFEQKLFQVNDEKMDRQTFVLEVVQEYIKHLCRLKIAIPSHFEQQIIEELTTQVSQMLMKKIYGFLTIQEFRSQITGEMKKTARRKYTRLKKVKAVR